MNILFYISCKRNKETNVPHLLLCTKPYLIKAGTEITDVFLYFVRVKHLSSHIVLENGSWSDLNNLGSSDSFCIFLLCDIEKKHKTSMNLIFLICRTQMTLLVLVLSQNREKIHMKHWRVKFLNGKALCTLEV